MTITLSLSVIVLLAISAGLFALVTLFCAQQGLFFDDYFGIGGMFALAFYAIFWAIPSLIAWGVWATWFKS